MEEIIKSNRISYKLAYYDSTGPPKYWFPISRKKKKIPALQDGQYKNKIEYEAKTI